MTVPADAMERAHERITDDHPVELLTMPGGHSVARAEPAGGQFALGGGRFGAKPAEQRPARRKKAAPGSVLGYNPKTGQGTGYGSKNGDARVRSLQEALNKLGLTDSSGKPLKVDGKLGPKTTAAIKKLQQALGMTPNGRVTPLFLSKVTAAENVDKLKASVQKPAAKPAVRADFFAMLGEMLVRHPGHPDQKVHGRRGPGAVAKAAVKKAVMKVAEAATKKPGELKPKKDMTFNKFRDFQNAMEAREISLSGDKLYPSDERLPADAYKSRTIQAKYLAPPIAERWKVDRDDLEELAAENMRVPKASLKGVPTEQLKRDFVEHSLIRHGGGGGATTVAQAAAVADHLGLPYEPTETDVERLKFIKERPALDRALSSLGIAQYEHTQQWLKDHGITEVTLARGMSRADGDREGLPYTSWAASYGGVLGTEMGFSNLDFDDPEVQQQIYDAERPVRVATVPAELILSTGLTGFGTLNESEAVVLPLPKAPDADADPLTAKYKSERPSGEDPPPPSFDDDGLEDFD